MFFAKLFTGKIGELLAPSPKPKEEFHSFLKAGLTDKALNVLRNTEEGIIDVNEIDISTGMAPIHIACALGAMELVVELLSHGADIGLEAKNGSTCLHFAAINDRKGIVEILLRSGADRSLPNKEGLLPVELASVKSVKELFLRDRSNIFSPIVQTRILLTDYVEQMQISPVPVTNQQQFSAKDMNNNDLNNTNINSISTKQNLMNEFDDHGNENNVNNLNISKATNAATLSFSPQKTKPSSVEDNYTIVGVSSTKKPTNIHSKNAIQLSSDDSSDSNSPNNSPIVRHNRQPIEVPKLNFGKLDHLPPPPTSSSSSISTTLIDSNVMNNSNSRSGSINYYHPNGTPVAPEVAVLTPLIDTIKPSPRNNMLFSSHTTTSSDYMMLSQSINNHNNSSNSHTGIVGGFDDSYDQDVSELRDAVVLAAIQTAHAMQSNRDDFETRRLIIRNCQKVNEIQLRKLLTFDPKLSMCRATEMLNLAMDGQTPLHIAAGFGNLKALQIMIELGQKSIGFTLWIRDIQGRTPLHVAAEKGQQEVCVYLREMMKLEKLKDPVGEDAPTDLAGTTPLGWASYGSRGKPKKHELIDSLFKPGDRSILPKTPGKSPWKASSSVGYDMLARENVVFAFSEASGWTPYMEDRIFVSCPVSGRPAWSFFGVCDGHGGSFCSDYLARSIPTLLIKEASNLDRIMGSSFLPGGTSNDSDTTPLVLKEMLLKICADVENELREHPRMIVEKTGMNTDRIRYHTLDASGSTAILSLVTSQYVAIANVGDSRAVLAQRCYSDPTHNHHTNNTNTASESSVTHPFGYSPRGSTPRNSISNTTNTTSTSIVNNNIDNITNTPTAAITAVITTESGTGSGSNSSRCVLTAISLSRDHKVTIPEERERIELSGAIIEQVRVDSDIYQISTLASDIKLRMTRSFGDFYLKQNTNISIEQQAIIAIPEIEIHHRNAKDAFLVLACDGIWDVMTNQEVIDYIGDKLGYTAYGGPVGGVTIQRAATACDALLQLCLEKGTVDNISVILIVLGTPSIPSLIVSKNSNNNITTTPNDLYTSMLSTPKTINNQRIPSGNTIHTIPTTSIIRNNHSIVEEHEANVDLPIYTSNNNQNTGCLNEVFEAVANDISIEDINIDHISEVITISTSADEDIPVMSEFASPLHTKTGSTKVKKQLLFQD